MPAGFFSTAELHRKAPVGVAPRCNKCKLFEQCQSPKMKVSGKGQKRILIIGEAPGKDEDRQGRQFVGLTGQYLSDALQMLGVDMRQDCWLANSLACRPKGNATPTLLQVGYCRPNIVNLVKELKPEKILLFGAAAVQSLIGWLWKEDVGAIGRWIGWKIPCQRLNAWVCPMWHPSFVMRSDDGWGKKANPVRRLIWLRHLKAALKLENRPWSVVPDWKRQVGVCMDIDKAAQMIPAYWKESTRPVAFDLETNRLKPDHPNARIVSCSLSDGYGTLAYPWHGEAIRATKEFLFSPVPKIGFSNKFEDRWCRKLFGRGVRNWFWDGMLAAHVLDCRKQICSLKFQSFVNLGQESYDDAVKPFLEGEGGNGVNRIKEVDLPTLLTYNGLDSLLEHKLAMFQARQLGVTI
jgi:DNA polymerase